MKNILSILALAFLVSMMTASASEIEITSPVAGDKYYVWDEVPIDFTSTLGEGYSYMTFVNGVPTDVFAPEIGGRYVIKVLGENPDCEECSDYAAKRTINVGSYPRLEETRIETTSPALGTNYYVGDNVTIEFESPLTDRTDFIFNTYVTGPDRKSKLTNTWAPTVPGRYGIRVEAVGIGNGFTFCASHDYEALPRE